MSNSLVYPLFFIASKCTKIFWIGLSLIALSETAFCKIQLRINAACLDTGSTENGFAAESNNSLFNMLRPLPDRPGTDKLNVNYEPLEKFN